MAKKLSKKEIEEKIREVLCSSKIPSPQEIKKIKKLAMSRNVKLGELRKKFCKKCYTFFTPSNCEIRIKRGFKRVKCKSCGFVSRYRIKNQKSKE